MGLTVPKGWQEVSIEQFLKYTTICTRKWEDPIDLEINVLATFTGKDPKEIEKLKTKQLMAYIKEMSFLKSLPKENVHSHFKCNGNTYRATLIFDDMTAAQFCNFSDILKGVKKEDYIYQMHNLLAAMCVKGEGWLFTKYEYKGYVAASDEFYKHLPISIAYPYYFFFCRVIDKALLDTQSYLNKEMEKLKRSNQRAKWGLRNIGAGIWSTIRSATTTRSGGKK
jgi:hypothetical protein